MNVLVGRQPILDHKRNIYGYELLFRSGKDNFYSCDDPNEASLTVIGTTIFHIGLKNLVGKKKAFFNFTRDLLRDEFSEMLPKNKAVIEILEDIIIDDEVIAICKKLSEKGYSLALDDVLDYSRCEHVIDYIDYVKVDWILVGAKNRKDIADKLKDTKIKLVAEKIETNEDFEMAKKEGYDLFQGYFFKKPQIFSTTVLPSGSLVGLELLQETNKANFNIEDARNIIKREPSLAFNLLKFINSAALALVESISSLDQALILLGTAKIRRWVIALVVTNACSKNPALIRQSVERARMCELMGDLFGISNKSESLFLLGLLSLAEGLMNQPLETILGNLNIDKEIEETLLNKETELTPVINIVKAVENGDWDAIENLLNARNISKDDFSEVVQQVMIWSSQTKIS